MEQKNFLKTPSERAEAAQARLTSRADGADVAREIEAQIKCPYCGSGVKMVQSSQPLKQAKSKNLLKVECLNPHCEKKGLVDPEGFWVREDF